MFTYYQKDRVEERKGGGRREERKKSQENGATYEPKAGREEGDWWLNTTEGWVGQELHPLKTVMDSKVMDSKGGEDIKTSFLY